MKYIFLFVALFLSFSIAQAEELRDIHPPVEYPFSLLWLFVFIVLVVFVIIVYFIWRRLKNQKNKGLEPEIIRLPWEVAYERLEGLKHQQLAQKGFVKEYYSALSDIVRAYIEERFNIRAPEMTTQEFLCFLKCDGSLKENHKKYLEEFLNVCDMVKFAKYGPGVNEMGEAFGVAKKFVDETTC